MSRDLTLVVLAAGLSTRYGRAKQLDAVGPAGETLMDYAAYDAARAGFTSVALIARSEMESLLARPLARLQRLVPTRCVWQELSDVPPGHAVPPGRQKPWGTGHAILAARRTVREPFAVVNADDYYGPSAFRLLRQHLHDEAAGEVELALVGYRLRDTLPESTPVSRAVCRCGPGGRVEAFVELRQLVDRGGRIEGIDPEGRPCALSGLETVSMNAWAFTPAIFDLLWREFGRFLDESGPGPDAEFLVGTALTRLIAADTVAVRLLPAVEPWFGLTSREDLGSVSARIAALVEEGVYPPRLIPD